LVTVTIPAGCQIATDGIDMKLTATAGSSPVQTFSVTAAPKPTSTDWHKLRVFGFALVIWLVLAVLLYVRWVKIDKRQHSPAQPLVSLDTAWNFKDTWVSNVTVAGGLLTAIFGATDVVKPLLGSNADASIALATLGAAVATAFIAAGPIVLLAFKSYKHQAFTVGGLLLAAAVTLTGASGQLYIAYVTIKKLDLDGLQHSFVLPLALGTALALLLVYSYRSLMDLLKQATTRHRKVPSDTILAAKLIAKAIAAGRDGAEQVEKAMDEIEQPYPAGTSPGDTYLVPGRSALL
jgi:hypothetical protein